jgi:hypothetical protein
MATLLKVGSCPAAHCSIFPSSAIVALAPARRRGPAVAALLPLRIDHALAHMALRNTQR